MLSFWQEPLEIANYIKSKKSEIHFDYDEILYEAHHKAFTIAKITKIDLLNDIKDSLENSFKSGITFKQWKQDITPTLQDYGWIGKIEAINPSSGIPRNIYVGSRRLKNIFDTNMRVAYSKANYESGMQAKGGYFRYVALLDSKTRNSHKDMHGIILPKIHPFWDKNYPPNDWGCRCKVQTLTIEEIEENGFNISKAPPKSLIASHDWAYNPGKNDNLYELLENKSKKIEFEALKNHILTAKNEIDEDEVRWKELKELYNNPYIKKTIVIAKAGKELQSLLNTKTIKIFLSNETIIKQKEKHSELHIFDYYLISHMTSKPLYKFKDGEYKIIFIKKLNTTYRITYKVTQDKKEIYVVSLFKYSNKNEKSFLRDIENLKRSKKEIKEE